jgi:hypothetical protein
MPRPAGRQGVEVRRVGRSADPNRPIASRLVTDAAARTGACLADLLDRPTPLQARRSARSADQLAGDGRGADIAYRSRRYQGLAGWRTLSSRSFRTPGTARRPGTSSGRTRRCERTSSPCSPSRKSGCGSSCAPSAAPGRRPKPPLPTRSATTGACPGRNANRQSPDRPATRCPQPWPPTTQRGRRPC